MKLSIVALVLSMGQINVLATPTVNIPLNKRSSLAVDGVVNAASLQADLARAMSKYDNGFASYKQNTGNDHPLAMTEGDGHTNGHGHSRRGTAAIPLTSEGGGTLWQGTITAGTPPQSFTVDFDTGSSDFILAGPNCGETCVGKAKYQPAASNTSRDLLLPFMIKYGDGTSVQGEQYVDTVRAGGLSATSQNIGAATVYPPGFQLPVFAPDGLLGMAFQTISVSQSTPFFQNLISQGQTTQPVFAFKLTTTGAELFLGGTNPALYTGQFTYVPVTTPLAYWQVPLDAVTVNCLTVGAHLPAVIDTGTTFVVGDPITVAALYAAIPGSKSLNTTADYGPGFYSVPCAAVPFINVNLTFGGVEFPISPTLFNFGQVVPGSADCVGGIMSTTIVNFWIIGDIFLGNVYTAFDVGQNRVGFAQLAP